MKLLAFESSAKAAGVAVLDDGRLLAEYFQNSGQTHSRTLMQMAENLLRNCDLGPQDIDACAVADGPGSFTGVRIGVAAAKGFSWGREIACYGVSTLEAMARGAELCYTTLLERLPQLTLLPEHLRQQRASGVALAAWEKIGRRERGDAASLVPNYLRLSQAERARLEKTKTE